MGKHIWSAPSRCGVLLFVIAALGAPAAVSQIDLDDSCKREQGQAKGAAARAAGIWHGRESHKPDSEANDVPGVFMSANDLGSPDHGTGAR